MMFGTDVRRLAAERLFQRARRSRLLSPDRECSAHPGLFERTSLYRAAILDGSSPGLPNDWRSAAQSRGSAKRAPRASSASTSEFGSITIQDVQVLLVDVNAILWLTGYLPGDP